MRSPAVSLCVPAYNGSRYLGETLSSALGQTFRDYELLVLDDASTDRTLDVARSFADVRLRVHRNATRLGIPENWNECLRHARGEYVKFLFQDDTLYWELWLRLAHTRALAVVDEPLGRFRVHAWSQSAASFRTLEAQASLGGGGPHERTDWVAFQLRRFTLIGRPRWPAERSVGYRLGGRPGGRPVKAPAQARMGGPFCQRN